MSEQLVEKPFSPHSGWGPLVFCVLAIVGGAILFITAIATEVVVLLIGAVGFFITGILCLFGFLAIAPNQARVLLLFGDYRGTISESGFFWVNPFFSKKKVSLRVRNFETGSISTPEQKNAQGQVVQARQRTAGKPSKVNDRDGNPIEISAVVVLCSDRHTQPVVNTGTLYQ